MFHSILLMIMIKVIEKQQLCTLMMNALVNVWKSNQLSLYMGEYQTKEYFKKINEILSNTIIERSSHPSIIPKRLILCIFITQYFNTSYYTEQLLSFEYSLLPLNIIHNFCLTINHAYLFYTSAYIAHDTTKMFQQQPSKCLLADSALFLF